MYVGNFDPTSDADLPGELDPRELFDRVDAHLSRAIDRERRLVSQGFPGAAEHLAMLLGQEMETPYAAELATATA